MNYIIIIFQSTHQVLKAEKILLGKGLKFEIIPTPKEISSECGLSIRIDPSISDSNIINALLSDSNIKFNIFEKWMK
jgi:hypothetical protein